MLNSADFRLQSAISRLGRSNLPAYLSNALNKHASNFSEGMTLLLQLSSRTL